MKKILFATVPADGHFNPLTGLAKHLQSKGYDVRWYAATKYQKKLRALQIPFYPFGKEIDISADDLGTAYPEREKIKNPVKKLNFDLEHFFIKRGPQYFEEMKAIRKTFAFDLLIADVTFTGSVFVKDLLHIPVIAIGVLPLVESSKDLAPSGLGMEPASSMLGKTKQALLRWLVKKVLISKPNKQLHRILDSYNIEHHNIFLFDLLSNKADLILQSGTPGFEYERSDLSSNIRFIGPLLPYSNKQKTMLWFDERLTQYKRIVLLTQGTVEKDPAKIIVPTLEAFKGTGTLVVCTTGGSKTAELKKQYDHDNIIIEDFIPFEDIMPYADVYITNGGYGGVMLGIENKLPMVVAGVHEGKNEICARVGYLGYGINLKTETPSPFQLEKAVAEAVDNPIYKKNIETLCKEFESYDANELCEGYVRGLLYRHTVNKEQVSSLAKETY